MPKQEDCLICFRKIRAARWNPSLNCDCRPHLHRICWEAWTDHIGYQTCVICRFPEPQERPPQEPPPQIPADPVIIFEANPIQRHPRPRSIIEDIATVIGVFFLIWIVMIMAAPQQHTWKKDAL